jgi:flagellar basal-body rod protein FlgB
MELKNIFTETLQRLEKNLDLRSRKHDLIVSNIANKDTPGYKAFDLIVEEEIKGMSNKENLELARTHPMHTKAKRDRQNDYQIGIITDNSFTTESKENSVDLDREMGKLAENNLMFNVTSQIISKKINSLKNAIQGGNK